MRRRAVLDDERLAQPLVQLVGQRAHEDVAGAAGARGGDHADGPRRIVLRERRGEDRNKASAASHAHRRETIHGLPRSLRLKSRFLDDPLGGGAILDEEAGKFLGRVQDRLERAVDELLLAEAGSLPMRATSSRILPTIALGVPAGATSAK